MELIRTIEREFPTGPKAVLHLEGRSGTITVEGRDTDRVSVEAILRMHTDLSAEADDAAVLIERNMEQDGHRVIIRTPSLQERNGGWTALFGQRGASVDYRVLVPRQTAVRVLSRSGAVQICRTEGVVHTEALSGKIAVEDVKGDVTAVSRSGTVTLERIEGGLQVEARSGRLRVSDISGGVQAEARSGQIDVLRVAGDVRINASSGSLTIEQPGARVQAKSRAGSVRFKGAVHGDVDIEAHAGSIVFAVDPAFPFYIDAESHVGSVRSDLPPRAKGDAPQAGGPRVRLRTRAGSIRITAA